MGKTLVKSEEFKDSPLEQIPKDWETPILEEVCSLVTNGYVGPTRDIYRQSGIPYLVSKNVKPNAIIKEAFAFVDNAFQREISDQFYARVMSSPFRLASLVTHV